MREILLVSSARMRQCRVAIISARFARCVSCIRSNRAHWSVVKSNFDQVAPAFVDERQTVLIQSAVGEMNNATLATSRGRTAPSPADPQRALEAYVRPLLMRNARAWR